jgi:hypothetical protein
MQRDCGTIGHSIGITVAHPHGIAKQGPEHFTIEISVFFSNWVPHRCQ